MRQQVETATVEAPAPFALAVLPEWEAVDLALLTWRGRALERGLELADLIAKADTLACADRRGFPDRWSYLEDRTGHRRRTLQRWVQIRECVERLPEPDRDEVRMALLQLGSHKAGTLAPLLGRGDTDWRDWVEQAQALTEPALQERVNEARGMKTRDAAGDPDVQQWYARLLALVEHVSPDAREEVECVFAGLMKHYDMRSPLSVFLVLVRLGAQELAAVGKWEG